MKLILGVLVISILILSCKNQTCNAEEKDTLGSTKIVIAAPEIDHIVVDSFPHDTLSLTEGFLFYDGKLIEGTGSPDMLPQMKTMLGEVDLSTGRINNKIEIDSRKYFGEGISFFNNKFYQLTWTTKIGFIYDSAFNKLGEFIFPGREGWGLTNDGNHLVMSDGSDTLYYFDTTHFKTIRTLKVTDDAGPVKKINELEYINGFIYANILTSFYIIKIDPGNGKVIGKIDLTKLGETAKQKNPSCWSMNGIAYDSTRDKVYITGKMWQNIYEIRFNY